jgi:hypothetical protein
MTTTIVVSRGLCSPMRDDVLTALKPYGVRILALDCWGEGHWHIPVPDDTIFPDADIWVKKHIAHVTVSDAQAAWAERLLWQSNKVWLESKPINPRLKWEAPPECKVGAHGTLGRGHMPTPWAEKAKQAKPQRGILGIFAGLFGSTPATPQRTRRTERRQRRTRR